TSFSRASIAGWCSTGTKATVAWLPASTGESSTSFVTPLRSIGPMAVWSASWCRLPSIGTPLPSIRRRSSSSKHCFPFSADSCRHEVPVNMMRSKLIILCSVVAALTACRRQTAEDHFRKGVAYFNQARYQEAVIELRNAIQIDPRRGDIRLKLGDTYLQLQN